MTSYYEVYEKHEMEIFVFHKVCTTQDSPNKTQLEKIIEDNQSILDRMKKNPPTFSNGYSSLENMLARQKKAIHRMENGLQRLHLILTCMEQNPRIKQPLKIWLAPDPSAPKN